MDKEKIVKTDLLRERNYGFWENHDREYIKTKYPLIYDKYERCPLFATPPGGDVISIIIDNVHGILKKIAEDPNEKIILVTHKTTGRLILSYFSKIPFSQYRNITFENGSMWKIVIKDGEMCSTYNR